jgi:molecular chaperone IbpA
LAGFKADDIHVSLSDNILTIKGADDSQDVENYIVKGIASRKFEKTFSLNEYAVVENVSLKNGILDITINIVLPEEKQPQIFKVEE